MKFSIAKKQLREFGFLIGIGFPIIIGWIIPTFGGHPFKLWTIYVGIPSLILGILKPELLINPYKAWMKLGYILGWINSRIILGLVFLLVLQPIALIMKIFGYDPLRSKKNNKKTFREKKDSHQINLTRIF